MTDDFSSNYVEVMEVEGSRPVILNSPSSILKHNSEAKRRWLLLKNLAVATRRRTSLTSKEEDFLERISKQNTTSSSSTNEKRESFLGSLSCKTKLTNAEHDFLNALLESDHVTEEQMENVKKVLQKDPIFQYDPATKEEKSIGKQEPPQRSASFREEVWTKYESLRHVDEVVKEQNKTPLQSQPSLASGGLLPKIFGRGKKEKPDDVVEEDPNTGETAPEVRYSILGASGKDPDCQPHVLSPPMMDALRKFMPFAVSEDNFWLKYSMTRDVSVLILWGYL